jgi:hypothetical protein
MEKLTPFDIAVEIEQIQVPESRYDSNSQKRSGLIESTNAYTYTNKSTQTGLNRDNDSDTDRG